LKQEREQIAFAAHTGDEKAQERLMSLHSAAIHYDSEGQSILAALAEARRRRATAEQDLHVAQEADRAKRALAALAEYRKLGTRLDATAAAFLKAYTDFAAHHQVFRELGYNHPTQMMVRTGCRRALLSALIGTDLQVELLPPPERHTFSYLVDAWSRGVEAWAAQRLPTDKDAA
jgi:hypothetical protein